VGWEIIDVPSGGYADRAQRCGLFDGLQAEESQEGTKRIGEQEEKAMSYKSSPREQQHDAERMTRAGGINAPPTQHRSKAPEALVTKPSICLHNSSVGACYQSQGPGLGAGRIFRERSRTVRASNESTPSNASMESPCVARAPWRDSVARDRPPSGRCIVVPGQLNPTRRTEHRDITVECRPWPLPRASNRPG